MDFEGRFGGGTEGAYPLKGESPKHSNTLNIFEIFTILLFSSLLNFNSPSVIYYQIWKKSPLSSFFSPSPPLSSLRAPLPTHETPKNQKIAQQNSTSTGLATDAPAVSVTLKKVEPAHPSSFPPKTKPSGQPSSYTKFQNSTASFSAHCPIKYFNNYSVFVGKDFSETQQVNAKWLRSVLQIPSSPTATVNALMGSENQEMYVWKFVP